MDLDFLSEKEIYPIQIPTPFAVGDVYSYLMLHEKVVLVDCGHSSEDSFYIIQKFLNKHGFKTAEIDEIWLTHGHPDHFGQAARLKELSGAAVLGHSKERLNFAGNRDRELFGEFFREQNIPKDFISIMIKQLDWLQQYQAFIEPEWIDDDLSITTGSMEFKIRHTPGHAPGHVCYYSDEGIIFGGDLLLEHVSTNALINFDPDTELRNKSLLQYRKSLNWIKKRKGLTLPGHGNIIQDSSEVAGYHLLQHEKRFKKICGLIQKQPMSLMKISSRIFPDEMNKESVFLVLSEVMGYLDWGVQEGVIRQTGNRGEILYTGIA